MKLLLRVDDGVIIFAEYYLKCTIPEEKRKQLTRFHFEADGIIVYPDQEILNIEWILRELGIPYTIEAIQHDPAHIAKTQGIKYASRSEAIKHLQEDVEPESQLLPGLLKRLQEREVELSEIKKTLKTRGIIK